MVARPCFTRPWFFFFFSKETVLRRPSEEQSVSQRAHGAQRAAAHRNEAIPAVFLENPLREQAIFYSNRGYGPPQPDQRGPRGTVQQVRYGRSAPYPNPIPEDDTVDSRPNWYKMLEKFGDVEKYHEQSGICVVRTSQTPSQINSDMGDAPHWFSMHLGPVASECVPQEVRSWKSSKPKDIFQPDTPCICLDWSQIKRTTCFGICLCRKCLLPPQACDDLVKGRIDPHIMREHAKEFARTVRRAFLHMIFCGKSGREERNRYFYAASRMRYYKRGLCVIEFYTHAAMDHNNEGPTRQHMSFN